jgi:ribonucleoside-diphosphate reductase alpha chain
MGGVRRASGISLSDLHDREMRDCKQGEFWTTNDQRNQANNSAVYNEKPDPLVWMEEWLAMAKSGSGERGIFNRGALKGQFPKRRKHTGHLFGTNPCGEIILRHKQFCNLSIAVIRPEDSYEEIERKIVLATIWGTIQSTMTRFNYISEDWKKNSEEERLLGVDLLGFLDHPLFQDNAEANSEITWSAQL